MDEMTVSRDRPDPNCRLFVSALHEKRNFENNVSLAFIFIDYRDLQNRPNHAQSKLYDLQSVGKEEREPVLAQRDHDNFEQGAFRSSNSENDV